MAELRGKLAAGPLPASGTVLPVGNTVKAEALSALLSLGLDRAKAERALNTVLSEQADAGVETLIKMALKNL
jgi:Holliday junction DNA helicase RuvA